jgi:hypothetical protein
MSETVLQQAQDKWIARVLSLQPSSSQAAARPGDLTAVRLATLRKTFDNVRIQAPEIAIRPMQEIASELAVAELTAEDAGAKLPPDAAVFKTQVDRELDGLKGKAQGIAAGHVADWQRQIDGLPAAGSTPETKKKRAEAINALLGAVEPGIAQVAYMLKLVGGDSGGLDVIEVLCASLKEEYKNMIPARTSSGPPADLPAATKPPIALIGDKAVALADALKSTQALMGADEQTDPNVVEQAVALIKEGINHVEAKAELQTLKTWVKVKEEYHTRAKLNPELGKAFMAKMWWYRRMLVDETMTTLQRTYDFTWGSVGSDNPESDYDLTVRTHGKKGKEVVRDYKIVELANAEISKDFGGTPPGILFDTNLYAEAAVNAPAPTEGQKADPAFKAMGAMKEQGQDVGALMKLRRYMEWDEYDDYKQKMLAGIADPAARKVAAQQFEEADSLYFVARSEQLMKAEAQHPTITDGKPTTDVIAAIANTPEGQKQLLALAAKLEHDDARAMEANNAIYLEKMEEVRKIEGDYDTEKNPQKQAALLAKLKSLQADATFFAAEAYHSEGPLLHVVKAGQSSKLEIEGNGIAYASKGEKDAAIEAKKQEKLAGLTANQMLQSFNENLGDLLKDLRHYASDPFPGLGFYRSSKYIERLCDAVGLIVSKMPTASGPTVAGIKLGGKAPSVVQTAVAGLVDIRGEKKGFPDATDTEQEKQAYAVEEMTKVFPGVTTLPDLAKVIGAFGREVNAAVRSAIAGEMSTATPGAYFGTRAT